MNTQIPSMGVATVLACLAAGCATSGSVLQTQPAPSEGAVDATIHIRGLSCPYCVYNVERSLRRVDEVKRVAVDLNTGIANIWFAPGKSAKEEELRRAVKDSGFTPTNVVMALTRSSAVKRGSTASAVNGNPTSEFLRPTGIEVDAAGRFYVADSGNDRIEVFDSDGELLRKWGRYGADTGQFNRPMDVALDEKGRVYVADTNNDRVQAFTTEGAFVSSWGQSGDQPGELRAPTGLDIGPGGEIYVAEFLNHRVQVFDSTGKPLRQWGRKGHDEGDFYYPTKVTIGPDGRVYVADTYNHRVQLFAANGKQIATWGTPDKHDGGGFFNNSGGVAVGAGGRIWVADFFNNRIQVFNRDGVFQKAFTGSELGLEPLRRPTDVAIGRNGTIYVVDYGHNRVQRWTLSQVGSE